MVSVAMPISRGHLPIFDRREQGGEKGLKKSAVTPDLEEVRDFDGAK